MLGAPSRYYVVEGLYFHSIDTVADQYRAFLEELPANIPHSCSDLPVPNETKRARLSGKGVLTLDQLNSVAPAPTVVASPAQ
jgi:hypothetical protein